MSYCWLLTHIQGHIFHAYVRRQQYIKNIYRNERTWATNCICHWSCPGTNNLAICWGYNVLTLFRKSKKDVFTVHGSRRTLPFPQPEDGHKILCGLNLINRFHRQLR
jgi:hypothetical protein